MRPHEVERLAFSVERGAFHAKRSTLNAKRVERLAFSVLREASHAQRSTQNAQRSSGFTLIEVLVALAIMALMAAMAWRAIDGMTRTQQATHEHADATLTLQAGLDQWRADLDAMMNFSPNNPQLSPGSPAAERCLKWDGSVLRLTRADSAGAGVRVVAWARRPDDGQWLRWQSAPIVTQSAWAAAWEAAARWGQAGASAPAPGAPMQAVAIVPITGWQLYYYRNNAWTNPLSSDAEAANNSSSATNNPVPDGVRLLLTLPPGGQLSGAMQVDRVRPTLGGRR